MEDGIGAEPRLGRPFEDVQGCVGNKLGKVRRGGAYEWKIGGRGLGRVRRVRR